MKGFLAVAIAIAIVPAGVYFAIVGLPGGWSGDWVDFGGFYLGFVTPLLAVTSLLYTLYFSQEKSYLDRLNLAYSRIDKFLELRREIKHRLSSYDNTFSESKDIDTFLAGRLNFDIKKFESMGDLPFSTGHTNSIIPILHTIALTAYQLEKDRSYLTKDDALILCETVKLSLSHAEKIYLAIYVYGLSNEFVVYKDSVFRSGILEDIKIHDDFKRLKEILSTSENV